MCGIAGLFRPGGIDAGPVRAMLDALAHRGPDDEGLALLRDPEDGRPWAALGARRLSIVDPGGGHQPARDPSGRWRVTLNGEIYNHARLRTEVAAHGVRFRSRSDTEVVASLVALHGFDTALERLRGMFALALVDTRDRRLHLVRDRMGVKPLYWTVLPDGTVAWGSEARALLVHPALRRRLDRRAVEALLLWEYVPAPWTPWQGIQKLEAGTVLEADAEGVRLRPFWRPPVPADGRGGSLERWARSVAGSVQVAVMQRMSADVEVGAVISGGLDSASVAALAAARRRRPLRTFSVAVDAPGFDEGGAAREVAAALGTEHREIRFRAEDALAVLPEILEHMDEPLADSSLLPTWWRRGQGRPRPSAKRRTM